MGFPHVRDAALMGAVAAAIVLLLAGVGSIPDRVLTFARERGAAAVFFVQSISIADIQNAYRGNAAAPAPAKVKILIVPGHQPDTGGTEFGGLYERDLVVDIADSLADLLRQNPHYDVMVARTKTDWSPVLSSYFVDHAADIDAFRKAQAALMAGHIADGSFALEPEQIFHPSVQTAAATELYGINKWASDNKYDITLHLHLNDYGGRRAGEAGKYDGFAVYVPDPQYSNAAASRAIGEAIAARLSAYHATSTLPDEDQGVVPDRQLIAVGSNNSADDAAVLIEYGYIYEPQFQDPRVRGAAIADYAYATYLGLQDFMQDPPGPTFGSAAFPYDWTEVTARQGEHGPGIYALQAALHHLGFYPPALTTFSDCPVTGKAGACTKAALTAYQMKNGIAASGIVDGATRDLLNRDLARP